MTLGISRESCQREYAHAVARTKSGFNNKIDSCAGNCIGVTSSPRPRQVAADSKIKNGTSDPISDPNLANSPRVRFVSKSRLSASNVAAASLLPPPKPAPCGIFFFSSIETAGVNFVAAKKLLAARTTRLSSPDETEGSSQRNLIPFPMSILSILISSWRENRCGDSQFAMKD